MNTDKKLIIIAVVLLILMGVIGAVREYRVYRQDAQIDDSGYAGGAAGVPEGTVCTMDAYECPDGSWVGRTGPNCEFVCPEASSTATSTSARPGGPLLTGELVGQVLLGPTCPVVQNPPSAQCADKPYQTLVTVSTDGKEVGRQTTDAQGRFMFSFLPGTYIVHAQGGATLPRCADETVVLKRAATTTVEVSCDTGIR